MGHQQPSHRRPAGAVRARWLGVLREPSGRGGSAFIHDRLRCGDRVAASAPRNNFRLPPPPNYLFVAGGIGITPLLPMVHQAEMLGADWRLLYGGRSLASMAFRHELAGHGDRAAVVPQNELGPLDLVTHLLPPDRTPRSTAADPLRCSLHLDK